VKLLELPALVARASTHLRRTPLIDHDEILVMRVLVTGAAGDIGQAVAERLAARGKRLVLADHPSAAERLAATTATCIGLDADVTSVTFDVADERATGDAVAELDPLDGLVNNAGYQGVFAPIDAYPLGFSRSNPVLAN
jgi:NAD(P)-dependent dehydrogenase (short-subunit alcohol dehydrogenase family)